VDLHRYRFRSVWPVDAAPEDAYRALREIEDYPAWWPEVRSVTRVDESTYDIVCRSTLPYDLSFRTVRSRQDPKGRVLEAAMTGDLDGFSRWTVVDAPAGSSLVFEEQVEARKALLRRLGLVARPAFVANHAAMMRHGRAGLRAYLAGLRRADVARDSD
jgi:Polyketide cyclase / dehydrase and lipid transport